MLRRYAVPGESLEYVYEGKVADGVEPPEPRFVRMETERPGLAYVCRNNFDGTGSWVFDQKLDRKLRRVAAKLRPSLYLRVKSRIRSSTYEFLITRNYLSGLSWISYLHLAMPSDAKKKAYAYLILPLSFFLLFVTDTFYAGIIVALITGMLCAYIHEIFSVYSVRLRAAEAISDQYFALNNLKNMLYVSVGFRNHPAAVDAGLDCPALTQDSARQLQALMVANAECDSVAELIAQSKVKSNADNFHWATQQIEHYFDEIEKIAGIDEFREICVHVRNFRSYNRDSRFVKLFSIANGDVSESYIQSYFYGIEKLELLCQIFMMPYVRPRRIWHLRWVKIVRFCPVSYRWLLSGWPY